MLQKADLKKVMVEKEGESERRIQPEGLPESKYEEPLPGGH